MLRAIFGVIFLLVAVAASSKAARALPSCGGASDSRLSPAVSPSKYQNFKEKLRRLLGKEPPKTHAIWQRVVKIFVVTDRSQSLARLVKHAPKSSGRTATLQFGTLWVRVAANRARGTRSATALVQTGQDPALFTWVESPPHELSEEQFILKLRAEAKLCRTEKAAVYVHGIDTSLIFAAAQAVELYEDIDFRGVRISFAWPASGKTIGDLKMATHVGQDFSNFMATLMKSRLKINLIGHSAGTVVALRGLSIFAKRTLTEAKQIDRIILAHSPVQINIFRDFHVAELSKLPRSIERLAILNASYDTILLPLQQTTNPLLGLRTQPMRTSCVLWNNSSDHHAYVRNLHFLDFMRNFLSGGIELGALCPNGSSRVPN